VDVRRQRRQPFAHVAVQEDPRLARHVMRDEEILASEREREHGSLDPARKRDSGQARVVVFAA
jgi:hypothetical protein